MQALRLDSLSGVLAAHEPVQHLPELRASQSVMEGVLKNSEVTMNTIDATNSSEHVDIASEQLGSATEQSDEQIAEQSPDELHIAIAHLFGEAVGDEWRMEDRAAQGLAAHLAEGESFVLANTVKLTKTGCLAAFLNMPDRLYSVAVTEQRLILAPINLIKPSSKATIYAYDQLSMMYYKSKHWVITTKDRKLYPFRGGFGCGPGADEFLKALFAHFYEHASKVIVPPEYADRDIKVAIADGKVTVLISE